MARRRFPNLEKLIDIIPIIVIGEFWVECPEVRVIDIFENQAWRLALQGYIFSLRQQRRGENAAGRCDLLPDYRGQRRGER